MKHLIIGAHLHRRDVDSIAAALEAPPLILSGFEIADDQPPGDRELLIRVAKVRAELLDRAIFVAIRYGFAARSAAEAAAKCAPHLERWRDLLELHRDHVEMTLKVAAASSQPRPMRTGFTSGAEYLKALHAATNATMIDEDFRTAVGSSIAARAVDSRWIHRDNATMELAFLTKRAELENVRQSAEMLRRDFPHVPFLLSGPWPLEVFADADHE